MTTVFPAQCFACTRLRPATSPTGTAVASTCDAYPAGIPFAIASGDDHRGPRGDEHNGLVFDQADTDEGREAFAAWSKFHAVLAEA